MVAIRVAKTRLEHRALFASPKVRSWHESIALRSKLSADERVRKLGLFCDRTGLTPAGILGQVEEEPEKLAEACVEYAKTMQRMGNLDSGTAKVFDAIRAWIRFNGEVFECFPSLHVVQGASLRAERTPTQDELRRLLSVLSPRGRVSALMMAHAGLRPGSLCNINGTDGLMLGDIPELSLDKGFTFKKLPFMIRVPAHLSKTRVNYITFGGSELAETLQTYLTERRSQGEKISVGSPIVAIQATAELRPARVAAVERRGRDDRKLFITSQALTKELRDSIMKVVPEGVRAR